jgi:hypothetical protein
MSTLTGEENINPAAPRERWAVLNHGRTVDDPRVKYELRESAQQRYDGMRANGYPCELVRVPDELVAKRMSVIADMLARKK